MACEKRRCAYVTTLSRRVGLLNRGLSDNLLVALDDCTVFVALKFSRRRSLALHVYQDERVEVRAPRGCPIGEINRFIHAKRQWIAARQEEFRRLPRILKPGYAQDEVHLFLGEPRRLDLTRNRPQCVRAEPSVLHMQLANPDNTAKVKQLLEQWYREQALLMFPGMLDRCLKLATLRHLKRPTLVVRKMKSRWGSCSRSGQISLNSLLIMRQPDAIEYIIVHELCHLIEFNHSRRFYFLLECALPDWKRRRDLLD